MGWNVLPVTLKPPMPLFVIGAVGWNDCTFVGLKAGYELGTKLYDGLKTGAFVFGLNAGTFDFI